MVRLNKKRDLNNFGNQFFSLISISFELKMFALSDEIKTIGDDSEQILTCSQDSRVNNKITEVTIPLHEENREIESRLCFYQATYTVAQNQDV